MTKLRHLQFNITVPITCDKVIQKSISGMCSDIKYIMEENIKRLFLFLLSNIIVGFQ